MRIKTQHAAIFGLSGNPPTQNHALFIRYLLGLTDYDIVRVVLSHQSPLKSANSYLAAEARFELLNTLLTEEHLINPRCVVERIEIDRPPPSYMVDTLRAIIAREKVHGIDEQLTLVLGYDALPQLTQWHQWQSLSALCRIVFYPRKGELISDTEAHIALQNLHEAGFDVTLATGNPEQILMFEGSASAARAHYAANLPGRPSGITPGVHQMILERGYYGTKT